MTSTTREDSREELRVDEGVVTGGGKKLAVIEWKDGSSFGNTADRESWSSAEEKYSATKAEALARLLPKLKSRVAYWKKKSAQIEAIVAQVEAELLSAAFDRAAKGKP